MRIGHLLRRTMMMPTWADMVTISKMDPSSAVDMLLTPLTTQPTAPAAANDGTSDYSGLDTVLIAQLQSQWTSDAQALRNWWINLMVAESTSIVEKMTMFWSGHFTSQFLSGEDYDQAPLLYRQNSLFRSNVLGNFHDLTFNVTLDPAMLVYLGGNLNTASHANENYARELMELFTTGLDQYSQTDVEQSARILTGWRVGEFTNEFAPNGLFNTYFSPPDHDTGSKTFMGVTFPAIDASLNTQDLVKKNEIQLLIDTIFSAREQAVATFICTKIYQFFVYSNPSATDMTVVSAMATLLINGNWEIKPVMAALLKSAHFFDNLNIGAQIKTPAEFTIGMARQFNVTYGVDASMNSIGQQLQDPPNVSGWPGWRDWINTSTYPTRSVESAAVLQAMTDAEVVALVTQFPSYTDPQQVVNNLAALLLPRPLSSARSADFLSKLLNGSMSYEWQGIITSNSAEAANNIRSVLSTIIELPDFQLC
jgi:uncharacterized protein (DUF1800 family)